jgi:Cysteine-rich domain
MQESERLQVSKHEMTWLQSYTKPAHSADVVLNLSCGVQTVPSVMLTQVALFEALGIDFVATAGQAYCCGRTFQRFGKADVGDRMAATSIRRFSSWQPTTNVQCCGSCLIEFDYHVSKAVEETGSGPFDVVHVTRFVLDRLREMGDRVPWAASVPRRVLLHAEGAEVHPTKEEARRAIIETLALVPGVEFVGLAENPSLGQPCSTVGPGQPSVLNDISDEEYRQVQAELEQQLREAGADAIVTPHHMCHREWCKFGSDRVPVIYYQALILEALGIRVPDRFQALWRLADPELILQASRPHWESWGIAEPDARDMVRRHFVPRYAAAVQRCPCEGSCTEAVVGSGDAACHIAWDATLTAATAGSGGAAGRAAGGAGGSAPPVETPVGVQPGR